ncbi:hydroxyphenylacetyl-CoA thioesterase PaaI [Nesterenkonia sp. LB17]|uniref:hydroxyphenylacetyl-CoA thioesterase PaaI n=1 Tax=unclassified Nesterenkonia TaxID=2629769 RepID=UPI001F4CB2EB|nr:MULTISPECIES: hydroxyphenylacetyl-CoA thioesterase PaaI [unclassified Nesterenkonia]MCH8559932.1 hydroxyphenylacetyl-CoA thioesterase PaaI [Nesterenkonia sp. DZ6]MCH8562112.1 hydroxyphenylacetyl-CoA thioesterase PaaI [Nesterenkonia sp. YGD6]MCH8564358.1 hydroxyphenylacetyl-CoA thioesterase PaaI [Nesterenkonia sp. LB17]
MTESTQLAPEGLNSSTAGRPRHRMLDNDRASEALGIVVLTADPGHARISMVIREDMTNGFDIAHGGMLFALADTCFAMACNHPSLDEGTITVASGVDINFLKPALLGETIIAEAIGVANTGRSGVYDVTITRGEDLLGVFRGRSRTIASPGKK